MQRDEFEKNWHLLRNKIQEKWGDFTNDEITKINGKYENLIGQLQKKYGYTKDLAEREIQNWQEGHSFKKVHKLWSEESPAEIESQKELVHEDQDPIYPLDSGKAERLKNQNYKEKKRKAG